MTTSPASTRSSYSSTTHHGISQHLNSPPAPTTSPPQNNLTQLLPDPVKLIDERIKVNQYCFTMAMTLSISLSLVLHESTAGTFD